MPTTQAPSALDQLFFDIFVTALEGGIGYWSTCQHYHWSNADCTEDHKGFLAHISDSEDEDEEYTIDRNVVAKGYGLATSATWRSRINWSSSKPPVVVGPDTDWDYDAGDADVIVQLGLFGDVVYG